VVFAGRLTEEKGIVVLLEAARLLIDAEVKIVIAGSGPVESTCRQIINDQQLHHVSMVGWQDSAAIDRLIQSSQALLMPSIWYENAPMSVYESLALGTPVIASELGGLPELIESGVNGYLFPAGDATQLAAAIQYLLMKPLHFSENQYNKYNQADHITELLGLYHDVISQTKTV
jgi:glycosyltransferase involved in cell wall biosynthesis